MVINGEDAVDGTRNATSLYRYEVVMWQEWQTPFTYTDDINFEDPNFEDPAFEDTDLEGLDTEAGTDSTEAQDGVFK